MPRTTLRSLFALLLVMMTGVSVQAGNISAEIASDFAPRSGYLVRAAGDGYLIDLDARQQVAVGDLFAVVAPGEPIVHPVTQALVGSEDTVQGLLQVTRVKAGYSECRAVGTAAALKRGAPIRRFQNIDARFWDYTGYGESLFRELQAQVPLLQWQDYRATQERRPPLPAVAASEQPSLYFILTGSGLEVRAPDFSLMHRYPLALRGDGEPMMRPATAALPATVAAAGLPAPSPAGSAAAQRIWTGPILKGTPVGLEIGDFDGDGKQEIAVAFGDRVEIFRLAGEELRQLAVVPFERSLRAYHLDGADLEKSGRMQLYLSAVTGSGNPSGLSIAWRDGAYRITRAKIPWHLRRITLPGEGNVLAAQKMGIQGREYAGPVFRVILAEDRLTEGDPIPGPAQANLYDFTPVTSRGGISFARLVADGYLKIVTPDGRELGETVDKTGGSESHLEMDEEAQTGGETRVVYLPARFEATERGEVLVPANSAASLLSRVRSFSKSQLQALVLSGGTVQEAWHTEPEKNYLADFRVAEAANDGKRRLVTVVAFPEGGPFSFSRKAALQIYSLPEPRGAQ
ncbi:hypothetical protein GMST_02120 [Geomonas silvestris]|uniref:VCBS repeat-containing protein n=1 Tax=Geomonas silvestris TaxID=2740184 RepID=A0A6V8MD60_9BACT|nr:VCBS repeat-containing protein [Geomonas silvestris]GFO57887.1 hypothetical protein GMST_02120 [Geomonas silvestris]